MVERIFFKLVKWAQFSTQNHHDMIKSSELDRTPLLVIELDGCDKMPWKLPEGQDPTQKCTWYKIYHQLLRIVCEVIPLGTAYPVITSNRKKIRKREQNSGTIRTQSSVMPVYQVPASHSSSQWKLLSKNNLPPIKMRSQTESLHFWLHYV